MDRLAHDLELARDELAPEWTGERAERLYAGTLQLGQRRARQRMVRASLLVAVLAVGGVGVRQAAVSKSDHATVAPAPHAAAPSGHTVRLADGSHADLLSNCELEVTRNEPGRVGLRLRSGRAHFEVVPDALRSFVVESEPYRVEVIGTIFDVERGSDAVGVSVTRGKVRVYGPRGAEDLVAGQIRRFELPKTPTQPEPKPAAAEEPAANDEEAALDEARRAEERPATRAHTRNERRPAPGASWRSLSQSGQYEAAFESLRHGSKVENEPASLMDAADAARLSGHARDAVQYLARVVHEHAPSPVAPLAAFTLGRVYLDQLGQPEDAAKAFELARTLAPNGSLAQDALAREVEALSKGGSAQKAYLRAREYLERYPNGQRRRAVQLYGGLE